MMRVKYNVGWGVGCEGKDGGQIKQVKGLRRRKQTSQGDNFLMSTTGKGWGRQKTLKGEINDEERKLDLGW